MDENGLIFRCFASGSSGNCYYLGTRQRGVLIDAGISARSIQKYLRDMGLDFHNIMGVLITHDHADHIRAVGTLGERVKLPIYTTAEIHEGIDRNYGVREKLRTSRRYFNKGEEWELFGMKINTFGIEHDSTDCLGYCIDYLGQRFVLMTDCGSVNEEMEAYIRTANHLVIESNHDEHMLLNGPYPTYLKERILSDRGHQSNDTCGELLARNYHEGLRHIFLCHLSQENNEPALAVDTVTQYLESVGAVIGDGNNGTVLLRALERKEPSPLYILK
jgi:phosphoribosyl 1,2-cyclic phosphodiesterase